MSGKFMFSKSAGLACSGLNVSDRPVLYYVYNGNWEGERKGDQFTCTEFPGEEPQTITDWEEIDSADWTAKELAVWYVPEHLGKPFNTPESWDDDIAF